MNVRTVCAPLLVMLVLLLVCSAVASDCVPYCDSGKVASPHSYFAVNDGQVTATLYGFQADFSDYLLLYNVTTGVTSEEALFNQGGPQDPITLDVSAGDMVSFFFVDLNTRRWFDSEFYEMSDDGVNHVYGANSDNGVFIGLEDLVIAEAADFDYNDLEVTATNLALADWVPPFGATHPPLVVTPEPGTLLLLASGAFGLASRSLRRK